MQMLRWISSYKPYWIGLHPNKKSPLIVREAFFSEVVTVL
jgi:hypothetical protein